MNNNVPLYDDSIHNVVNDVIIEQYQQESKFDALLSRIDSIMDITQPSKLDTILSRFNTMMEYGIGYHDAAEHVALPLLIALFAFSFTFLFPAINHINNKYNSPRLSYKFSHSFPYIFYWACTILDVVILIVYGFVSFFAHGSTHLWAMNQTWALLVVAAVYSTAIVWFVMYCIQFNKPSWLLKKIGGKEEIIRESRDLIGKTSTMNIRLLFGQDVKRIHKNNYRCVLDIYRYALNHNDMQLFDDVMDCITKVSESEQKTCNDGLVGFSYPYYSSLLFDNAISIYAPMPENLYVESSLVRNQLNCFRHRYFVGTLNIAPMMKIAEYGHTSMMEKHIEGTSCSFNYIRTLPQLKYIQGANVVLVSSTESICQKSWEEVCRNHYILMAYWIAKGHYSFMDTLINIDRYSYKTEWDLYYLDPMYPIISDRIISTYVKCVHYGFGTKLETFDWVDGVKLELNKYDVDKYTAALLMLANQKMQVVLPIMREEFEVFKKNKDSIVDCCEKLKQDDSFTKLYPSIKSINSQKLIDEIENEINPDKRDYLFKSDATDNLATQTLQQYLATINIVSETKGKNADLWNEIDDGMDYFATLGKLSIHDRQLANVYVFSPIKKTIATRALYLMLSIYSQMQMRTKRIAKIGLDECLKKVTNGKPDEYILIDLESQLISNLDSISKRYEWFNSNSWPYEVMESSLYSRLKGSLYVVEKKFRPFLSNDGNNPEVIFENKSSIKDGTIDYHITFDPHLIVKHNKNAIIYRIVAK